jgi:hypothetical protein
MASAVEESPVPAKMAHAPKNKIDAANGDVHAEAASHDSHAVSDDVPNDGGDPKSGLGEPSGEEDNDDDDEDGSKVDHRRVAVAFVEGWAASQVIIKLI